MEPETFSTSSEDNRIMISAIEHYSYCPRQCALIHVEQVFEENLYTQRGQFVHERVDEPQSVIENGVRVERALPLWSDRLGLVGKADVVEFPPHGPPYPVEYKSGSRGKKPHDDLQLCAQALCLEEMLNLEVPKGAVFYHSSKKRKEVIFTPQLRSKVEDIIGKIRELLQAATLPPPVNDPRCRNCSLIHSCMPQALSEAQFGKAANLFRP